MTPEQLRGLRDKCEAAEFCNCAVCRGEDGTGIYYCSAKMVATAAISPDVVLALLDEIARLTPPLVPTCKSTHHACDCFLAERARLRADLAACVECPHGECAAACGSCA